MTCCASGQRLLKREKVSLAVVGPDVDEERLAAVLG